MPGIFIIEYRDVTFSYANIFSKTLILCGIVEEILIFYFRGLH